MSNIYNSLNNLFKKELWQVAIELNYSKENVLILQNNFYELEQTYPKVLSNLRSCIHQRDKRTIEEYAKDLISSWIYEDIILNYLSKKFNIKLYGTDRNRNILQNNKISSDSDFCITKNKKFYNIELVNSYTNYWKKFQRIDLRDNKFENLRNKQALLICIDIYNKEFYLIDLKNEININYINYHKPWRKPAYQINIQNISSHDFTIENLLNKLEQYING